MQKNQEIQIFQGKNGAIEFQGDMKNETIWGNINQIADLFGVQKPAISKHIKNIFTSGELSEEGTVSILETVQKEGERYVERNIEYYDLDMIISIGYHVNSKQATEFRKWSTSILKNNYENPPFCEKFEGNYIFILRNICKKWR